MTGIQIKKAALDLGLRAEVMEMWLQAHPELPEIKRSNLEENIRVMFAGEKAIYALQERIDHLSAYIMQRDNEVKYTRNLIDTIIKHER